MNTSVSILFLFQTAEHVRFRKRVALLMDSGAKTEVLAFERKSYPGKLPDCEYATLGSLEHSNYFKRVGPFIRALRIIRSRAKDNKVIYAFGLDMLLLGWLASTGLNKKLVYEVGDIREVLIGSGLKQRFFRLLERFLLKRARLLVVTSEAYLTEFFNKIQGIDISNSFVIENKLVSDWSSDTGSEQEVASDSNSIRIGYFGVLRCRRSLEILKTLAEKGQGAYRIYLRGISRVIELQEETGVKHIEYGGPYLVPDDLPEIYGRVDLVWACYPYQGGSAGNWQWAKTVRFYEACFFKKPLIVQAGTEDSRVVQEYDIGLVIDMNAGVEQVLKQVRAVTLVDMQRWADNLRQLPEEIYLHTDEHEKLLKLLS